MSLTLQRKAHGGGQGLAGAPGSAELSHGQDGGHAVRGQGHVLVLGALGQLREDPQAEVIQFIRQRAQSHAVQDKEQESIHAKHLGKKRERIGVNGGKSHGVWVKFRFSVQQAHLKCNT